MHIGTGEFSGGHTAVFNMENQQGPAGQHRGLCSMLCNNLMVPRGRDGGRDGQGLWDGHGHTAVLNMENQQGPAGQRRNSAPCLAITYRGREATKEYRERQN